MIDLFLGFSLGGLLFTLLWEKIIKDYAKLGIRLRIGQQEFSIVEVKNAKR